MGHVPLYIRRPASELTLEYTCVIPRGLNSAMDGELDWMVEFAKVPHVLEPPPAVLILVTVKRRSVT